MAAPISPAKLVLLASHFATHGDIDNLSLLAAQHADTVRKDLVLRILLTYLPETVSPTIYAPFLHQLASGDTGAVGRDDSPQLDTTYVDGLTEQQAFRRAKKLRLLPLESPESLSHYDEDDDDDEDHHHDPLVSFLFLRGYRMDEEAGMLVQLPLLLKPFLGHSSALQRWMVSSILPFLRRNHEYYPDRPSQYSLAEFQHLPDRVAVEYLLAETGTQDGAHELIGRDLRGLVGPWLYETQRWKQVDKADTLSCPGWEQVLEWLMTQTSKSWRVALKAIEQWDGPNDVDLGNEVTMWLQEPQQRYLDQTYARAALAVAYLIPEATVEALEGAFSITRKIRSLMDEESTLFLHSAASSMSAAPQIDVEVFGGAKAASYLRNDLLSSSNPLTAPKVTSIELLEALILSAYLLTRAGVPCTVRRAGELAFIGDPAEQRSEITKMIRAISSRSPKKDDESWTQSRRELLWLHNWNAEPEPHPQPRSRVKGIFGVLTTEYVETEILKALLSNSRYSLARSIYEDSPGGPLPKSVVQTTVQNSALSAFDNATNPNRTRGGLKKCDEILHAFPETMQGSLPSTQRIVALLKATHALSDYRLVLKQGEPFSPVVLRVHSDPISIINKVLEQNPKAYTRLQEFLEMGTNMVKAGLTSRNKAEHETWNAAEHEQEISVAEKRIVAMCVEAALREDDFETAFSYVVSRLAVSSELKGQTEAGEFSNDWSWKAALDAGKYIRTARSQKPTHLGTASGNPEIRHLEQRIECLATALRIAPPPQLQEILKTFRRCEEQLDSAIKEEAAKEDALDTGVDLRHLPGAFEGHESATIHPPRNITASAAARQTEEAPMSLFDLSRATARVAQRNFNALSSLQGIAQGMTQSSSSGPPSQTSHENEEHHEHQRSRKRDQLREAATGTLVSGVGWLIGANMNRGGHEESHDR